MGTPTKADSLFENYPATIVIAAGAVNLAIYALGALVILRLGPWPMAGYLGFLLWLESRVLAKSCAHCAYFGKVCFSGKGALCSLVLKRGRPEAFANRKITWLTLLPDMLVTAIPLVAGLILLIIRFQWPLALMLAAMIALAFPGTGFIRGTLACPHCRQHELGCPAQKLFNGSGAR